MNTIQIYDPAMCCSSGVCGTDIDPDLVGFAAMLAQLGPHGVAIERYNLSQEPFAFAQNPTVKALLEKEGVEALPIIFLNGERYLNGRYPTAEERPVLFRAAVGPGEKAAA